MKTLFLILIVTLGNLYTYGQELPLNINLKTINNNDIALKEIVKDDLVLVTFWATWCKPCQSELRALQEIEEEWKDKIRVVAITIDDARAVAKVKSLVKGRKWPFEVYLDQNKDLYQALNITSIPYSIIVYKGKIVWTHIGYTPGNEYIIVDKALEMLKK